MTKEQIKAKILAENPSRLYSLNDQIFEMTDQEYAESIENRVEMEWQQAQEAAKIESTKASAEAKLALLGLTAEELKSLLLA